MRCSSPETFTTAPTVACVPSAPSSTVCKGWTPPASGGEASPWRWCMRTDPNNLMRERRSSSFAQSTGLTLGGCPKSQRRSLTATRRVLQSGKDRDGDIIALCGEGGHQRRRRSVSFGLWCGVSVGRDDRRGRHPAVSLYGTAMTLSATVDGLNAGIHTAATCRPVMRASSGSLT